MILIYIFLTVIIVLLVIVLMKLLNPSGNNEIGRIETSVKDEISRNRIELSQSAKDSREELNSSFKQFGEIISKSISETTTVQKNQLETFSSNLNQLNTTVEAKLNKLTEGLDLKLAAFQETNSNNSKDSRKELKEVLETVKNDLSISLKEFSDRQRENFSDLINAQTAQNTKTEEKIKEMSGMMEKSIKSLQEDNAAKLEEMRKTVDEKLEKTLSERLGQSFETVGKQLIEVQKGLGEMQTIAQDVGGLKKVLSNVKLRGGVGEVQLAMLLEQILAPSQYESNVRTKKGSSDSVEFAIKLPGRSEDENTIVHLPIDAKFPKDTYEHLIHAYENALPDEIEIASKNLETTIRKMAKDIRDKYIDPPHTTDFAIMFLPFESIYAEVIRRSSLVDQLRDEFKITVAGPTTLMAILNSLQMGFRTLSLQKRSSEVWKVLSSVKKEFENFGGLLEKAQKNFQTGMGQLDEVVGTRTRAINRQLRNVETLPTVESPNVLPEIIIENLDEEIEI